MFELGNKNFAFSSKYGNIGKFYSVYKRVGVHCKKTETDDRMKKNFCCIKTRRKTETHRTFRHICLCPTKIPTLRKAKRAFIFSAQNLLTTLLD